MSQVSTASKLPHEMLSLRKEMSSSELEQSGETGRLNASETVENYKKLKTNYPSNAGKVSTFIAFLVIILMGSVVIYLRQYKKILTLELQEIVKKNQKAQLIVNKSSHKTLPKIIWLFTDHILQGQKMLEQVFGHYIIHKATQSGWKVKQVNSMNAYDYMSRDTAQKITESIRNTSLEQKVSNLLRLGLLMDNGGVLIKVGEVLPVEGFQWLQKYFSLSEEGLNQYNNYEILLFEQENSSGQMKLYSDCFIAAVQGAQLIVNTFDEVCRNIGTNKFSFTFIQDNRFTDYQMNAAYVNNLVVNTMNSWLNVQSQSQYKAKIIQFYFQRDNNSTKIIQNSQIIQYLKGTKKDYHQFIGVPNHIIYLPFQKYRNFIEDQMQRMIDIQKLDANENSYWTDLMRSPYSQQLYQIVEPRPVHFCILDAHAFSDFDKVKESFTILKQQNYKQWTAVYFADKITDEHFSQTQTQKQNSFRMIISQSSNNVGRNYQIAITKLCPNKSFILVLKAHQKLSSIDSLSKLKDTVQPRNILGAFVSLNVSGQTKINEKEYQDYQKVGYNGASPRYEDLDRIINHLRVFHSDCYKIIPQFELRTPENDYFEDRFIFLQFFIRMVVRQKPRLSVIDKEHIQKTKWFVKSSRHIFDIPSQISFYNNQPLIQTSTWQEVNKEQLKMISFRADTDTMMTHVDHLMQNGQTINQFAVFNPGNQFIPYTLKKQKQQKIPKIIHKIWLDGELPEARKVIDQNNKKLYPNFEHKLWRKQAITRENFPFSFDILQNLLKINSKVKISRNQAITNIMALQIMYHQGGFFMDTRMLLFKDILNEFLNYKVVIPSSQTFRHRYYKIMCIFGNEPKYSGLLRVIYHRNTNLYNIFARHEDQIAGPYDFIHFIEKQEEYNSEVLVLGYDTFYPFDYSLAFNPEQSKCAIQQQYLDSDAEVIIKIGDRVMSKDCSKYYPYAFGKQLWAV